MMTNEYAAAGMGDSALAVARRLIVLRPNSLNRLSTMSLVFARFGARHEADSLARWVLALPESRHRPGSRVSAYLALGDTANALTELENAAATDGDLAFSTNAGSVYYDVLRGSPRFAAVLAKFHLDVARFTAAHGGKL
jgi:predicted Zn-dependent protease